jgi:hypothetical protein
MKNTMSVSTIKTIVVKVMADNINEFDIDTDVFSDPFIEAATRAIELTKKNRHAIIRPIAECWEKKTPKRMLTYNAYWILVNAGCYKKAEQLREKTKMQNDIDLATQPLHATAPRSKP